MIDNKLFSGSSDFTVKASGTIKPSYPLVISALIGCKNVYIESKNQNYNSKWTYIFNYYFKLDGKYEAIAMRYPASSASLFYNTVKNKSDTTYLPNKYVKWDASTGTLTFLNDDLIFSTDSDNTIYYYGW